MIDDMITQEDLSEMLEYWEDYEPLNLPRGYISHSQVFLYKNCGERYRRKYVLGQEQPASSNMVHGRMMHKIIENMLLYKQNVGKKPSREMHHDALSDLFDEYMQDVEVWESRIPDKETAEKESRTLLDIYYDSRLGNVSPLAVEKRTTTLLRERIPFLGFVDLIEKGKDSDDKDREHSTDILPTDVVADTKITGRTYGKNRVIDSLQLSLYSHIENVENVGYDLVVHTKRPKFVKQRSKRPEREKEHAIDVVEDVAEAISAGVFMKANPDSWMCSKKWCPFWDDCRGKSLKVSVPDNQDEE